MPTETFKVPRVQKLKMTRETRRCPLLKQCKISASPPKKDALPKGILHSQRNIHLVLKYTTQENEFLKEGITKHGFGQWTAVLRDHDFKFQDGRTADSPKKGWNENAAGGRHDQPKSKNTEIFSF